MRTINYLPLQLTIMLVMASMVKVAGQPVTNNFYCYRELSQIKRMFSDTNHVSFQTRYVSTYNDATSDTIQYQYKVNGDRLLLESSDSANIIQNEQYNLSVNHAYHRAIVSRPGDIFKYVAQVRITDPSFKRSFVTGMVVTDTGSYRKLSYTFKPASPYRSYDIIYDRVTYRIQAIQYRVNMGGEGSTASSSKMPYYVTILFSNYQTGLFTDSAFSTDGYFIRKQGICNMVAPYTSYQIKNLLNQ